MSGVFGTWSRRLLTGLTADLFSRTHQLHIYTSARRRNAARRCQCILIRGQIPAIDNLFILARRIFHGRPDDQYRTVPEGFAFRIPSVNDVFGNRAVGEIGDVGSRGFGSRGLNGVYVHGLLVLVDHADNDVRHVEASKIALIFDHSPTARKVGSWSSPGNLCE